MCPTGKFEQSIDKNAYSPLHTFKMTVFSIHPQLISTPLPEPKGSAGHSPDDIRANR